MIPLMLAFVAACSVTDLRDRTIPNWLTLPGCLAGFVFHGYTNGWAGLRLSLIGFAAAAAIYLVFFLLKGRGGGDLKMMAALGAMIGWNNWLLLFVLTSVLGGVVALLTLLFSGRLRQTFTNFGRRTLDSPDAISLPHAPVVAVAALFTAIAMRAQ